MTDADQRIGADYLSEIAEVLERDLAVWLPCDLELLPWPEVEVIPTAKPSRFHVATVHRLSQ